MQGLIGQGCRALLAAMFAALLFTSSAQAADDWRPVPQACVAATDFGGACSVGRGSAAGLWKMAVAPGGVHAYGIAHNVGVVMVFDRNPATGALVQRAGADGCLAPATTGTGCKANATPMTNANGIVISPDGLNVYVASSGAGSTVPGGGGTGVITVFDRNPATGDLTQKAAPAGCVTTDAAMGTAPNQCASGRGIQSVATLEMSPDGRFVYTAASFSVGVFQRNPATGSLQQAPDATGCFLSAGAPAGAPAGCTPVRGLTNTRQIALTPDGRSLYVPSQGAAGLVLFDRDPGTGLLAQKPGGAGCFGAAATCTPEPRLVTSIAATASPDNQQLYVSVADGILTYSRASDGSLTFQSCITDAGTGGCSAGRNLRSRSYSGMSPDGQTLVASSETPEGAAPGIAILDRDANGNLAQPPTIDGCVTPTGAALIQGKSVAGQCHVHPALGTNGQVTFLDDGAFFVGSHTNSAMVAFKRDLFPKCADQGFDITQNVAAALPFTCWDRNGDPMSFTVTSNPIAGAVGAVDQTFARVFYNPFSGYLGADNVRYRAVSTGLTSNEATLLLNVVPPVTPPAPAQRPRTVNSAVPYAWAVKGTRLTFTRLQVRSLPVGATVTIRCSGKPKCALKSLTIKRSRKSTMNVLNAKALNGKNKRKKTFRAGQTVDILVAAPNMNTKMLRFKLRKGTVPKHRTYCIPFGAKRAQRGSCS